jgi:hypothetical protein
MRTKGPGVLEFTKMDYSMSGWRSGEKVVIVAADLIYEEDGKTRRQWEDGGYITDIHGNMYIGKIDFDR